MGDALVCNRDEQITQMDKSRGRGGKSCYLRPFGQIARRIFFLVKRKRRILPRKQFFRQFTIIHMYVTPLFPEKFPQNIRLRKRARSPLLNATYHPDVRSGNTLRHHAVLPSKAR